MVTERQATPRSPRRPRVPHADLIEELIASMEEAVQIIAGEVPPSRVHTASELAVRAVTQVEKQG